MGSRVASVPTAIEHVGGGHGALAGMVHHGQAQRVGVHEGRLGIDHLHAVALQLVARHVDFMADHVFRAEKKVFHGNVLLDRVRLSVNAPQSISGKINDRLAQSLAGDGSGIDADAAQHSLALDEGSALVEFRRLDRRPLSRRSRSDDQHVIVVIRHCRSL